MIKDNQIDDRLQEFVIKSPSGKEYKIGAASIYHAVSKAVEIDGYKYSNCEYPDLPRVSLKDIAA